MSKIIEKIKEHYLIAIALAVLAVIRFTANIPILLLADSQKYLCSPAVIQMRHLDDIWISINFSLFERVLNYFIQVVFDDDLTFSIILNKLASLASTLLIYLILYEISKNKTVSLISAIVFSLSPALLYIENTIMPEAFFLFFILLFSYLIQKLLLQSNLKIVITLSVIAGLILGFAEITKQTADTWALFILFTFLVLGLVQWFQSKKIKYILSVALIYLFSFLPKLPLYIENARVFGQFDLAMSRTIDSGAGVFLWSLTEDMVYSNPPTSYPWMTYLLINLTEEYKKQFSIEDKNSNTRPFLKAVSRLSMVGRQGQLADPYTGQMIPIQKWSKICRTYWKEVSLANPKLLIERIFKVSFVNMFLKEDLGLFIWENSMRPGVNFQPIQYTDSPFSFKDQFDYEFRKRNLKPEKLLVSIDQVSKVKDFYSYLKFNDEDHYYLMVNTDTPYAFKLPINSISLWWQKIWTWNPWIHLIGPLFLISVFIYFFLRQYSLFDIYILCSALYFSLLPLLISLAEARYRLQFMPFMILFIVISSFKFWTKQKSKTENK